MAMHFGHAIFLLVFLAVHASSYEQEEYWKTKLPNVPMPPAIKDNLFHSHDTERKVEDIGSSTIYAKEKKASLNQPWTVLSWNYDDDTKERKVEDVASSKEKKVSLNQPWTVLSWNYDEDTKERKVEDVGSSKEKKASMNQPWTVLSWNYDEDTKERKVENVGSSKEKKASLNQPWTVLSWNNDEDIKERKVEDVRSSKEKKVSLNQPWTVLSWNYDEDTKERKVEDVGSSKEKKASLNQPWTVLSWNYDEDTKERKVEDVGSSKGKKASLNQPWTVLSWNYDEDTKERKVEDVGSSKEKKASLNQPWTVLSWNYDADNKDSLKTSHSYHHAMHNNINSDDAQEDLSGGSVFFVEKSLRLGMTLKHDFQKTPRVPFLPKHIAQSIPFSDDRIAEILNLFSIKSSSAEATSIMETLGVCLHRPKVKKENRTCAQSMEDVVDFVVGELGTNDVGLRMMRNDIEVVNGIKDYVITKVNKLVVPGNNAVACHRMVYPYVVYYCHHQQDIGHYDVTLVNPTSGTAIQTTAVCHYDTYAWQADVPALRYLGIRPGDAPVCHFSAINDMFWTIKDNSKSMDVAQ